MANTYQQVQGAIFQAQPIAYAAGENLLRGEKGPFAIPCVCDFGATGIPASGYIIDPSRFYNNGTIKTIQSIFFDNSQCNGATQVSIPAFNQTFTLSAGQQGYFQILAPLLSGGVMFVTSAATLGAANVLLLNTLMRTATWSTIAATGAGSVPVSDAILDGTVSAGPAQTATKISTLTKVAQLTATDRSGTIAVANTSQVLAAANTARQGLELQNMDGVNLEGLWYNPTGGAAVVGGVGSFELAAASSPNFPGGFAKIITSNAVSIIATTAGHKFSAIEY
jgi:hypothetical protein